jgi:hypothetical protein
LRDLDVCLSQLLVDFNLVLPNNKYLYFWVWSSLQTWLAGCFILANLRRHIKADLSDGPFLTLTDENWVRSSCSNFYMETVFLELFKQTRLKGVLLIGTEKVFGRRKSFS